jgi:hypothetical protein
MIRGHSNGKVRTNSTFRATATLNLSALDLPIEELIAILVCCKTRGEDVNRDLRDILRK